MMGVGGGKSHVLGFISMEFGINYPEVRGFIGANTVKQLSDSTLDRIFKVWGKVFNCHYGREYVVDKIPPPSFKTYGERMKSYDGIVSFNNGHLIFTSSLENYKAIDGKEFTYALLDETKDTREEAVKDVIIARLREKGIWKVNGLLYDRQTVENKLKAGIWKQVEVQNNNCIFDLETMNEVRGFNPLYIATSPAKVAWLNEWFDIDKHYPVIKQKIYSKTDFYQHQKENKCVVIASNYHNEKNLPPDFIGNLLKDYIGSENKANMLIYGDPIGKTGGEWWTAFDRLKHVKKLEAEAGLPFHITFDFNVVPYMTMLVIQIKIKEVNGKRVLEVRFLHEYCLENPNNKVAACCRAFVKDYGHYNSPVYYYGDKSGKNRQTLSEDYEHHYKVVEDILKRFMTNDSDRVVPNNPSLTKSRDFCNKILAGGFDWVEVYYDESMKKSILDKEVLKEDVTGGYKPAKIPHPETKIPYEPYGHVSDSERYFWCSAFSEAYNEMNG